MRPMSRGALYLRPSTLKTYKDLGPKSAGTSLLKRRSATPGCQRLAWCQQALLVMHVPREMSDPGEGKRTVSIIYTEMNFRRHRRGAQKHICVQQRSLMIMAAYEPSYLYHGSWSRCSAALLLRKGAESSCLLRGQPAG